MGERLYAVERPWGNLRGNPALRYVSQVAVDSSGRVYVIQRTDPPVMVFDPSGEFIRSWGTGVIEDPHGIYISHADLILLIDRDAHQVLGCDLEGEVRLVIGQRNHPRWGEPFNHPTDAAVSADGDIFVSDGYANSRVHRFSPTGEWKQSWGTPGATAGEFTTPHGIWIDPEGRVLVADRENNRIQVFSRSGEFLAEWPDVYHPMDIWGDSAGVTYVTDQIPRLSAFDRDGKLVGRCRPVLFGAHGVWGDRNGNIFLAEHSPIDRITRLVPVESRSELEGG